MNYSETFDVISPDLGNRVAMLACAVGAIHLSLEPTEDEYTNQGAFVTRLKEVWYKTFWEEDNADLHFAIKAWIAFCDYDVKRSLDGLGGCKFKHFDVIYNDPETYNGWDLS